MDFIVGNLGSIPLTPAQSYPKKDWEQKRPLVTQLYRDERKSLDYIRGVLAQQSFRPTAAMLKKRIKKWDLDRNHKQADMSYAVKIALERETLGKKTAFLIRGRCVTFEEVQHYFRRKGIRDLRALVKDADAAAPTTRIECYTPEPFAIAADGADPLSPGIAISTESSRGHVRRSSADITVIPDPNQVGRVLPHSLELSELTQLLHHSRDYYDSLFEVRDWKRRQEIFEITSLESFYHNLSEGHNLVNAGKVTVAFEHFSRGFDLVKDILKKGTLLFLPYLYHLLLPLQGVQRQDVLLKMLEFVSQMIGTRFPHLRPVQQSLTLLHGMSVEQRSNCSNQMFQCLLNRLQAVFLDDVPNESQLREATKVLCPSGPLNSFLKPRDSDDYKKTSLAVWLLYRDSKALYSRSLSFETKKIWAHREVQEAMNYHSAEEWRAPVNSRPLTTAALRKLDAELQQEDLLLKKSPRPRQQIAFKPRKGRLGKRHAKIQQPSTKSSF
ncbi:hypothetical protein B0O99DRAFT_591798 [Bisporella sp. PMI_857]|nr:hypothetical protein B0O99DRAFT_591798 [Bisporella sp. PMI_857]